MTGTSWGKEERIAAGKPLSLEELPEFKQNPFSTKGDIHVFEIAKITFKTTSAAIPPYQRQETVGIIGRSPDYRTIYFAREYMKREDGVFAIGSEESQGQVSLKDLERYQPGEFKEDRFLFLGG